MKRLFFTCWVVTQHLYAFGLPGDWGEDEECLAWGLNFKSEKEYHMGLSCYGIIAHVNGQYNLAGNNVTFETFNVVEVNKDDNQKSAQMVKSLRHLVHKNTCTHTNDAAFIRYSEALTCRKGKDEIVFWNYKSKPIPGKEMGWKGIAIVTMGLAEGYTNACVKIREAPSENAKIIQYKPRFDEPQNFKNCIPPKTRLIVLARTREKQKVQKWSNYWYLMEVGSNVYQWVFAEFVDLK